MQDSKNIEKAVRELLKIDGVDEKTICEIISQLPDFRSKVLSFNEKEIAEIRNQAGSEKIKELERILRTVK